MTSHSADSMMTQAGSRPALPAETRSAPAAMHAAVPMTAHTATPSGALAATPVYKGVRKPWQRVLLMALAGLCICLAIIGVFVPGLPSTEFVLLAAWASARSSPRLHAWLHNHKWFGPMLHNWHNGKRVARRAKIAATVSMSVCVVIMFHTIPHAWVVWPAWICMAGVLAWLWSRPEAARAAA
ncbi:Inner membrane protein ybaN [Bordetella ansorpii]|uniref:Inner membrane protein ybaN n=2 Tax=Bordetella ansorpii TaxID=288768 RepID=A0A157R9H8_9BORD|nr:Inner membrane protein ybaN [Bordetella ansorpii]